MQPLKKAPVAGYPGVRPARISRGRAKWPAWPPVQTLAYRLLGLLWLSGGLVGSAFGQACTGVLGGAVVNQTFGSNGPYVLQPGQTTYTPLTSCPNDGEYLIAPGLSCYPDNWHSLPEDHTPGDTKGNMMIVNAAAQAGEFYNQTVPGLCYGTTYEFSVWIINLVNTSPTNGCAKIAPTPLDPNINMRVELPGGQVLQTIKTGTIARTAAPTWVRYATVFTLPAGVNGVVIKLINNGPGGCGNDLALDDIQLRPCRPPLEIQFADAGTTVLSVCAGDPAPIRSALGAGYSSPAYQWQTSTDSLTWQAIAGAAGIDYSPPTAATGKRYYRLLSAPTPGGSAGWDTTCSTVSNTLAVITSAAGNCHPPALYAPDAFTPNNDGSNDRFRLYINESSAQLTRFELRVYDRWGRVIFTASDLTLAWDGTCTGQPCSADVYTWVIEYQLAYAGQAAQFRREGRVLLIR